MRGKEIMKVNVQYDFKTEKDIKREVQRFKRFLKKEEMSENTILGYTWTVDYYLKNYGVITTDSLLAYKGYLVAGYAPTTVNQRIQAINKYLRFVNYKYHLKSIKVQQKPFLENVISMQDYKYLKRRLKKENQVFYFLVWGMASTGARVSEALCIKAEHIIDGQMDFYGKGKKYRRIYFVKAYQKECSEWLRKICKTSGYIFTKQNGELLSIKAVEKQLKHYARIYNLDPAVMYPHSFRHLYGKTFYEKEHDLPLLADLMGHASLDTTRIYSRRSSLEQQKIVNKIVTW